MDFKNLRKAVFIIIVCLSLSSLAVNFIWISGRIEDEISDATENLKAGRPFNSSLDDIRYEMIALANKNIQTECKCFFWTPEKARNDIPVENDVALISYNLYPSELYYKHNRNIWKCEFIIASSSLEYFLRRDLRLNGLSDSYEKLDNSGKFIILKKCRK